MNIPLEWLSEYVKLPETVEQLTDRLTMIGHMLDKKFEVNGNTIIDLELRGNRSDLFGLIGIARDISAAWDTELILPKREKIPAINPKSTLVDVEATDLVERFFAVPVAVQVGASPEWLINRLTQYGMASINNVVDITNYVMIETGIPLHAFDRNKLQGRRLIIRRAKDKETMVSFMGGTVSLTSDDIALCDTTSPQAITLVGSKNSGTTEETEEIILEAAVYNHASVRQTSRRLGIRTEAGTRLEKHLDPNQVSEAITRALYLLSTLAHGEINGSAADYYPHPRKPATIFVESHEILRLTGVSVPKDHQKIVLMRLGCTVKDTKDGLSVTVPTVRTDILQEADLVEEIIRIVGYDTIPTEYLSGTLPKTQTLETIQQEDNYRSCLVGLQLNEVITSTFIPNADVQLYTVHAPMEQPILLTNAPDPDTATLRTTLMPNLIRYAKRMIDERATRVAIFEIGKIYYQVPDHKNKKKSKSDRSSYKEERHVGILLSGEIDTKSYNKAPRKLDYFDLKGVLEELSEMIGIRLKWNFPTATKHPSIDPNEEQVLTDEVNNLLGYVGLLDRNIQKSVGLSQDLYVAELSLDALMQARQQNSKPYVIAPMYPPTIEDIAFTVSSDTNVGDLLSALTAIDPLVTSVKLVDTYENKRTFRIIYQDPSQTLTAKETRPVREKILATAEKDFDAHLVE